MKINIKILTSLFLFITVLIGQTHAQASGEVIYKCTLKENSNFYRDTLFFNGKDVLYVENRVSQEWKSKEGYTYYVQPANRKWYFDLSTRNNVYQQYDFKKRQFRYTTDTLKNDDWKILNEFKTIDKYKVQKAQLRFENEYGEFFETAWFTTEIPIQAGPDRKWGLPGLVLELRLNGICTCTMESITMKPIEGIKFNETVTFEANEKKDKKPKKDKKQLSELLNKN
jgi:GLPGLI family protein